MNPTQVMRLSQADDQGLANRVLSRSSAVLVAVVVVAAIVFFSKNPFRVGEITVATPNGPSVTVKVANSNEISELIQKGLENKTTAGYVTNSLLNIIENLPAGSKLGDKLMELAEQRKNPFFFNSVPVTLVYDSTLPEEQAAVCETSAFVAKNIVVYVLGKKGELLYHTNAHVDVDRTFPCPGGGEIVRLNHNRMLEFNSDKGMVKRNL